MKYDEMLLIVVSLVSVLQFYLSFIKGRSKVKDAGKELYRLSVNAFKLNLLGLLFVLIIFYLGYSLIKSNYSVLGLVIVIYVLLCIFDFSKVKVITEKGIGQLGFYSRTFYNFSSWEELTEFQWYDKRKTMLIFKLNKNGKVLTKDWEVPIKDKAAVEKLFSEHVKMKIVEGQDS